MLVKFGNSLSNTKLYHRTSVVTIDLIDPHKPLLPPERIQVRSNCILEGRYLVPCSCGLGCCIFSNFDSVEAAR